MYFHHGTVTVKVVRQLWEGQAIAHYPDIQISKIFTY